MRPNKKICSFPVARPTLTFFYCHFQVHIFIVQINNGCQATECIYVTIIQLLALFKLILYSNLLTIINVALYFTFDSIIYSFKKN